MDSQLRVLSKETYSRIFERVINMVVAKRVIVIGDGPSGLVAANKLRFHETEKELEILVVGNTTRHFYKPDGLFIPFGYQNFIYKRPENCVVVIEHFKGDCGLFLAENP